jgi:multisubunit Na+/H+ antiporter MnhB subunit
MNLYKISKIVAAVLSLLGIIFLVMIMSEGDEAIKSAALDGNTAILDPMAWVTYIIFALTIFIVVVFVIKNLVTNTKSLKSTMIGIGVFLAILLISYGLSNGSDASIYKYDGLPPTEATTHMVGAGLISFYILMAAAAASMLFFGIKKITK